MKGGKPLPFYGDSKPNHPHPTWIQLMNGLRRTFGSLFVKNFAQVGWRDCDSETERQLARPLWRISPIGAGSTQ